MASAQAEKVAGTTNATRSGMRPSGPDHGPRILRGGRHPRLGQDVLAGLERGDRDRRVENRPGADEDRVERRVRDERLPRRVGASEPEGVRRAPGRFLGAVGDPDQLDAVDRAEARDVLGRHDPAGADDPDPDGSFTAGAPGTSQSPRGPAQPRRRDRSSAAVRTTIPAAASFASSVRLSGHVAIRSPTTRPRASRTGAETPTAPS